MTFTTRPSRAVATSCIDADEELREAIEKVSDYVTQLPTAPKVKALRRTE